jgi:SAM-dependent methyltransferase
MNAGKLALGVATFIPGVAAWNRRRLKSGGTDSARYCYSVWLRHLVMSADNGLCSRTPGSLAELGPGDSIGIGLAALLSGANRYVGLDVLPQASLENNRAVFEELVQLFRSRAPIPDDSEFPAVIPKLRSYAFPGVASCPDSARIDRIRTSICSPGGAGSMIRYTAPWSEADRIEPASVDMILSQAVMQHVDDLPGAYAAMRTWLAPGGWLSHSIDFGSHGLAREWNGHWAYKDWSWSLLRGKRPYLINRAPYSAHCQLLDACGFSVTFRQLSQGPAIERRRLAPRFRKLTDTDLTTPSAFLQATASPRSSS